MLRDIESREDLELLVNEFYRHVRVDEVLGPIFNRIIGDDWSHHLPIMYTFWNTVLFGAEGYKGQAVGKHVEIDRKMPLNEEHFDRWISLWRQTVDRMFEGDNADRIKDKANTMLQLIQFKVQASRSGKSLF
jgi:hemoglobin